jgi:hypothetical protein
MDFETLLAQAEKNPDDGALIASLLVRSAQVNVETLPDSEQERVYNLFAFVFANLESGPHNALQTALQRALSQPAVLEFYLRRMEASADFLDMLQNNAAAPVILALLCSHDDSKIAEKAAIALAYTGSELAYNMLTRWLNEGTNKKLVRAAQVALPYFEMQHGEEA